MARTELYLICADSDDGENLDMLVEAETEDQATRIWRDYAELNWLVDVPLPSNVWLIPRRVGRVKVHPW